MSLLYYTINKLNHAKDLTNNNRHLEMLSVEVSALNTINK